MTKNQQVATVETQIHGKEEEGKKKGAPCCSSVCGILTDYKCA